jgi:sugar phosphate isomerase/epimerase
VLQSFRRIVRAAEQIGVTVGVEGVFDHTLYNPKMMKRFLDDIGSENVEVILDAVNLIPPEAESDPDMQSRIISEAFELYGRRISVLHLKDFVFEGNRQLYRHPGEGHFHYPALMRHIRDGKPGIIGLLENSSPDRYRADCEYLQNQL